MKLHLDVFEGPLDLLLYLIKKNNLEISRVSIANITHQYLDYLESMKDLNVDMASEFLLMAAELAHMKSKAILPASEDENADEDAVDGTDQLVAKLRLYQHYKQLAETLGKRKWLGRDVFKRASFDMGIEVEEVEDKEPRPENPNIEVSSYDLVKAFNDMLKRVPQVRRDHRVAVERVSVTERIYEILDELRKVEHVLFQDLFKSHVEKIEYVVTFLALLEMGKLHMVQIYQTETYGPIRVQQRSEDVVEGVDQTLTDIDANAVTYK
jgi:segregation and condensation protein A